MILEAEWGKTLLQQVPWGVMLVYVVERFLRHLTQRDKTLAKELSQFTVAVHQMSHDSQALTTAVARLEGRFRG